MALYARLPQGTDNTGLQVDPQLISNTRYDASRAGDISKSDLSDPECRHQTNVAGYSDVPQTRPRDEERKAPVTSPSELPEEAAKQQLPARQLAPDKWLVVSSILGIASALPFVIMILVAIVWRGKPVNDQDWDRFQIAMKISVSLFPLIFSAVIGNAIRQIANMQLERGSTLGKLEQLSGSMTVLGAISTQVMLKTYNWLGLGIVLLWLISPFGGQASLHIIKPQHLHHDGVQEVQYLDINGLSQPPKLLSLHAQPKLLDTVYRANLLTPKSLMQSPRDAWSNIKIPQIRRLARDHTPRREGGRYDTVGINASYSSPIGVPVFGIPANADSTFALETSYIDTSCISVTSALQSSLGHVHDRDGLWISPSFPLNNTRSLDSSAAPQIYLSTAFATQSSSNRTVITCNMTHVYVEAEVACLHSRSMASSQRNCTVTSIRESLKPHQSSFLPPLMHPNFTIWDTFVDGLLNASSSISPRHYGSLTELYISTADLAEAEDWCTFCLYDLPLGEISDRFTQILNTFYLGSLALKLVTVGPNISSQGNHSTFSDYLDSYDRSALTSTTAHVSIQDSTPTFVVDWGWLVVMAIATAVIIGASVVSLIVGRRVMNPDIVGYASTLTRDAPHLPLPSAASTLNGFGRARWLADIRIRLGDVQPECPVGKLSISTPALSEKSRTDRLYF
ncbi:hypothetical protein BDV26DRAFT_267796 [Aspergillus bertholletiae]|uniref:Uncharacterized protein n=1 Tax=Aspergillus bertholletiae TaxID=1226010 RepID=A0A5N7B0J2_9EURO|nr:hypothetical protein BDV26DRAFT_267796 [Aspergillus bertholletiae]